MATPLSNQALAAAEKSKPTPLVIAMPDFATHSKNSMSDTSALLPFLQEYWLNWARLYNYKLEFKTMSHSDAQQALSTGKVHIIAAGTYDKSMHGQRYFSIPYMELKTVLYRRANSNKQLQASIVIHHLDDASTPALIDNQLTQTSGKNLIELLLNNDKPNYIYSWAPAHAQKILKQMQLTSLYTPVEQSVPSIAIRAITHFSNRQLMLDINEGLRKLDTHSAQVMWNQHMDSSLLSIKLRLGSYLSQLSLPQQEFVIDNPELEFGFSSSGYPPYIMPKKLSVSGFTLDIMNIVSKRVGIRFTPVAFSTFEQALDSVKAKKMTLQPNVYKTKQRAKSLLFSAPLDSSVTSIVSRDEDDFTTINALANATIAAVRGYQETHILGNMLPTAKLIYVDSVAEAITMVAEGYSDAYVGNGLNANYLINELKLSQLELHKAPDFKTELLSRIAVTNNNKPLVELIDLGLNSIHEQELKAMHDKWMQINRFSKHDARYSQLYTRVITIASIASIIILLIFMLLRWQLRQRRLAQVKVEQALKKAQAAHLQAEQAASAKTDFLARMSHEIRTPMNGVLGMAEALSFTKLNSEQNDLLNTLNSSARNLMSLLNDVLDFSKMDAGKLTLETTNINLTALLQGVIDNFRHKALSSGVKLSLNIDPKLQSCYQGDPTRLMQVLNNLVSNSLKFTEQGFVEISAQLLTHSELTNDPTAKTTIRIDVRDSGMGIACDKIETLFTPFVQADGDITRRFGGTGLGLSICKEIVQAMQGQINVSSLPGYGTLFSVTLQLAVGNVNQQAAIPQKSNNDPTQKKSQVKGLKILLVEDNAVNRKVVTGQLARLGLQVDAAENGLLALNMYKAGDYDVVLSDCHMPEMDGFALAGHISAERPADKRPVLIAITADALSGAAQKCYNAGFDDYLSKPCTIELLKQKLTTAAINLAAQKPETPELTPLPESSADTKVHFPEIRLEVSKSVAEPSSHNTINDAAISSSDLADLDELDAELEISAKLEPELVDFSDTIDAIDAYNQEIELQKLDQTIAHLNQDHVLELSGEDVEMAQEIMQIYLENSDNDITELTDAFNNKEYQKLKDVAHRIKGSVRYLGAEQLGNLAQNIEHLALQEQIDALEPQLKALQQGLVAISIEVQQWCQALSNTEQGVYHEILPYLGDN